MTTGEGLNTPTQDEINVPRWTSEEVLTTGVAQGWADPADWREVDFSTRPSCEGPYEFDAAGRPLNRHRTSDMSGDRGELGKYGPNYAAESLVVAVDHTGKRHILLARRNDPRRTDEEQQWSLPGGIVDADEHTSAAAIREVQEKTGVDLAAVPCRTLYQMYANDYRNTRNSWIEATGVLHILHYTPAAKADGAEVSATRWFELPDTLEELEEETGKLFASHGDGVRMLLEGLHRFTRTMDAAQQAHGQGRFARARQLYLAAADILPDPLEKGRATRGAAEGAWRIGAMDAAITDAHEALSGHDEAVRIFPEAAKTQARRERAASGGVLGRIVVAAAVRWERSGDLTPMQARAIAQEGVGYLDAALDDILAVEAATGVAPDQYKINIMSRLAVAHALYGDQVVGRRHAQQAQTIGARSEAASNPTSANLPARYRVRARARSIPRAYAALAASHLATRSASLRRNVALAIAGNSRIGL